MSVTLTTDPIVSEQLALEILKWQSTNEVRLAINSVSARFLNYTGRKRITSGAVTEWIRGNGLDCFWLHGAPVTAVTSIQIYDGGTLSETVSTANYGLNADTGKVVLHGLLLPLSEEDNVKAVYTGGWTTVPGDIQQSALALMRLDKARMDGRIGVSSEGREGFSASYETGDLPKSVADVWRQYRYMV
jgi:hypothetical protein